MVNGYLHVFWLVVTGCRGAMLLCPLQEPNQSLSAKTVPAHSPAKAAPTPNRMLSVM